VLQNTPSLTIFLTSVQDLDTFCKQLVAVLKPGDVLALTGDLGAGKTTFTQYLAHHVGIEDPVTSPTFALIHEYALEQSTRATLPENLAGLEILIHVDVYRLGPEKTPSLEPELSPWLQTGNALLIVEWANYAPFLNSDVTFSLQFSILPPSSSAPETRTLLISGTGLERLNRQTAKEFLI
jgi:tRNA threonylcarbamoyladenosine biosynthesis protein TsaE